MVPVTDHNKHMVTTTPKKSHFVHYGYHEVKQSFRQGRGNIFQDSGGVVVRLNQLSKEPDATMGKSRAVVILVIMWNCLGIKGDIKVLDGPYIRSYGTSYI